MKSSPSHRYAAVLALGCALLPMAPAFASRAQEEGSPTAVLLGRARTLEQRGRLDLAKQDWAQVLLLDPNDAEALAGLVRAARAENHGAEAAQYLSRLRAAHPNDAQLAKLTTSSNGGDTAAELAEAERLARAGDNRGAFAIYKRVYGLTPPAGAPALAYYQTEASIEGGRPQAIAGLRAFADRYPTDSRYFLALGRLLLTSPRTRAEGRTILERYPGNQEALAALHASEGAGEQAATSEGIQGRKAESPVAQVSVPSAKTAPKPSPAIADSSAATRPAPPSRSESLATRDEPATPGATAKPTFRNTSAQGVTGRHQAFAGQEQAGFAALNQHRTDQAEQIFHEILAKDPTDPRALAGLGYLRVSAGDMKGAVNFFERAQEAGDHSLALTRALVNAQFDLALRTAGNARGQGDVSSAESQYRTALRERPSDPEALEGLGGLLLQTGRAGDAVPVFTRLTQVRPMDPAAWRGLVISQASSGQAAGALATDSRVPADARSPLQQDPSYLQALATARNAQGVQLAKVEPSAATQPASVSHAKSSTASAPAPPSSSLPSQAPPSVPPPPAQIASPPVQVSRAEPAPPPPMAPAPRPSIPPAEPPLAAAEPPKRSTLLPKVTAAGGATGKNSSKAVAKATRQKKATEATTPAPIPAAPTPPAPPSQPARTEAVIAAERTAQGDEALLHGDNARAADLFRDAVAEDQAAPNAWKGLVRAMHAQGRDAEASTALRQIPGSARSVLDRDATFQMVAGEVNLSAERPEEALHAFARAQTIFGTQKLAPPLDLVMRVTSLLAARNDDANLYRELLYLGDRRDLTDTQRREVQMIWTQWAVRRARALAAAGEKRRAVTVLNAAASAFGGNGSVLSAVADGYAGIGLPREAVALYKSRDLSTATAHEIEAAISAGGAARDFRTAGAWARLGKARFANDPEMLTSIAELEQARGREQRAADLSRQAKALAPPQDPGQVLTAELREAGAGHGWRNAPSGQLATLLAPADTSAPPAPVAATKPFLPEDSESLARQKSAAEIPPLLGYDEPSR